MINQKLVIVGLLGVICTGSSAQPIVVPKNVLAQVGTVARFNCTAAHNEPVYWTTKPYGTQATHDMYIGEKFLLNDYGTSGRFSVEVNSTLSRHDLVIHDVKRSDAGVYICIDERGFGKKAYAELVVWDTLTCQEDQRQDSYMGENVFGLDQDTTSFICRMNYRGNTRPQFLWSVGGRKFNGTQGTEPGIASSSLILVAASKLHRASVTCAGFIRGHSSEDTQTAVLWTSDTIQVKYAMLKKEVVKECPGVENTLSCNPPCSYNFETANGTKRCAVSYSVGTEVERFHFYQSSSHCSEPGSIPSTLLIVLSCALVCSIAGFLGYFILRKRLGKSGETRGNAHIRLRTK